MATLLITDDSDYMRDLLRVMLARSSHTVIGEASGGQECIDKYRDLRPDIVLLDSIMPQMKGIETLRALLSMDPGARVIMVSADHQEQSVQLATRHGARGFVAKPFDLKTVVSEIDAVMKNTG